MTSLEKFKKHRTNDTAVEVPDNKKTNIERVDEDLDRLMRYYWPVDAHEEVLKDDEIVKYVVKVVKNIYSRTVAEDLLEAKKIEIEGVKKRETWTVANHEEAPTNAKILVRRFDLVLKNFGTPNEKAQTRFITQDYCDQHKNDIVHDSSIIRPSSLGIILSTVADLSFNIFFHDVTQAYVLSKDKLTQVRIS